MSVRPLYIKNFEIPRASYHLMIPVVKGFEASQQILFGGDTISLKSFFWAFRGVDLLGAYFVKDELRSLIERVLAYIQKHPEHIDRLHKETYELNDEYFRIGSAMLEKDFTHVSDDELGAAFQKLVDIQIRSHQHSLTTTWFLEAYGEDFSKYLLTKTEQYVAKKKHARHYSDVFSILTTAPRNSFLHAMELEEYTILNVIRNDSDALATFLALRSYKEIPETLSSELRQRIERFIAAWCWFPFTYMGPAYDTEYYLQVWAGQLREGIDADMQIREITERPERIREEREELFTQIRISPEDQHLYEIAADIAHLKGYRKDCMYHGFYALDLILREIAKRRFLSFEQVHMMTTDEVLTTLHEGADVDADALNARRNFTIVAYTYGTPYQILTGKAAEDFFRSQRIEDELVDGHQTEWQGTCACSGTAEGLVCIVNVPDDMAKMKKGDIMVSHTTYPSLVPAMKLAAAIVTEDGGVTCHAAIVSRELGTPCLTGVKVATRVFKDGDRVEVDANNGVVRKV